MAGRIDDHDTPALFRAAAGGDAGAWNALVGRYSSLIWNVARAHRLNAADAADVSQTTWLRLAEHLDRIRDPERLGSWLATTARRECLGVLRRTRSQVYLDDEEHADRADASAEAQVDEVVLARADLSALWAGFARLSEQCQKLLRLLFVEPPIPYAEVAEMTGLAIGSIGPMRARCLLKLRAACGAGS